MTIDPTMDIKYSFKVKNDTTESHENNTVM